ncbi:predicted protein [Histoplasma mississippiense (nom. inval.)]|uniref:predicted protein n=1 Tax=Ajellomyces capsulatus (strain NAm1 / WU24) TaxID=2059318 RepID=UPI000157C0BD|nr:predicted protein [Histoplasma mississippiense (nom. inval.)]EDN06437.1 predicted protein [Histoplasma mississippiense (nom. inval.)]
MASSLGSAFRSFWHTMTSNDRHASHDSPYRTGQHVPLSQNRNAPLTSVATSAAESRADLSFEENPAKRSSSPAWSGSHGGVTSPVRPYSPGMRSLSSQQRRSNELSSSDGVAPTEIQMQSFHAGAPPPPPVSHSWKKIDQWAESNYEELYDQLCEGCSQNDVNELEHELDCTLPLEVRESLQIHDGQERGGRPTAFGGSSAASSSSAPPPPPPQIGSNPLWRQELLDKQDSQPPKAIQKAYAHPSWIPLARDWGGNNIAVDLAPGPAGKWGQVIIFGLSPDSNNNKIDGTASLNSDATKNPNGVADAASSTTTTTSTTTTATASSDTSKSDVTTDDPPETGLSAAPPKEKEKEKHKRRSNLTSPRSSTGLDADALEGMKNNGGDLGTLS